METNEGVPQAPHELTSKEVIDFGKIVGKDVAKTTLVWTLAGVATKFIRDLTTHLKTK